VSGGHQSKHGEIEVEAPWGFQISYLRFQRGAGICDCDLGRCQMLQRRNNALSDSLRSRKQGGESGGGTPRSRAGRMPAATRGLRERRGICFTLWVEGMRRTLFLYV